MLQEILRRLLDLLSEWLGEAEEAVEEKSRSLDACYYEAVISVLADFIPSIKLSYPNARRLIDQVLQISAEPRGITGFWEQCALVWMAINEGLYHQHLKKAERDMHIPHRSYIEDRDERRAIVKFALYSCSKKPGREFLIRNLTQWAERVDVCSIPCECSSTLMNETGESDYQKSKQSQTYQSPVGEIGETRLMPAGWMSALGFGEIYTQVGLPEKFLGKHHSGEDLNRRDGNDGGATVRAIGDGTVVYSGDAGNWHGLVVIAHNGFHSRYGHVTARSVTKGQKVIKGQAIGIINSSMPYDAHLHFDLPIKTMWLASYSETLSGITDNFLSPRELFTN